MTREQFAQSYEAGLRQTVAVLRRRGAPPAVAEEIAQAAWVRGWERLSSLRDERRVVHWANSIACNLLRDFSLRSRRTTDLGSSITEPRTMPDVNEAVIDLRRALCQCRQGQKEALEIVYLQSDGRSTAVIAHDLGTSVGALHHRLSRAR